jgi:thiamine pyrophosphokinase
LGATGGDPAHEVANLLTCSTIPIEIRWQTQTHEYLFFNPDTPYSIDFKVGQEFSLFSLEEATGVTIKGARFPLKDDTLERGSRGLHNQATAVRIDLFYEAGNLMMIRALQEEVPSEDGNEA